MNMRDVIDLQKQLDDIDVVFDALKEIVAGLNPIEDKNEYKFYVSLFVTYAEALECLVFVCRHLGDRAPMSIKPFDFETLIAEYHQIQRLIYKLNKSYMQLTGALHDHTGPRHSNTLRHIHIWLSSLAIGYENEQTPFIYTETPP